MQRGQVYTVCVYLTKSRNATLNGAQVYPGMAEDAGPIPRHGALVLTSVEESKSSSWDPLNVGVLTGRKGCSYSFSGCCGLLTQEDRAVISEARKASEKALTFGRSPVEGELFPLSTPKCPHYSQQITCS